MVKYLFGHINPDTDSICSSIVYNNYLQHHNVDSKVIKLSNINNETKFILEKFNTQIPSTYNSFNSNDELILLDHNESSQSIENIEKLNVVEIIDHHKFNIKTHNAIKIRSEPVGSTCTIIAKILFENNYNINKTDASLLISGIISDTLYFRSPTTTNEDKNIIEKLNKIANITNLEKFSLEIFDAKSNLGNINANDLIKSDYKVFNFNNNKIGIGFVETTNPNYSLNRKDEIINELKIIKKKDGLNYIFVCIVDILNKKNTTLYPSQKEEFLLKTIYNAKTKNNLADLGNIISRKKEVVPKIEIFFS